MNYIHSFNLFCTSIPLH